MVDDLMPCDERGGDKEGETPTDGHRMRISG